MSDTAIARLLAEALSDLVQYVDSRPVDDDVAEDDVRALESVGFVLGQVAPQDRGRLAEMLGDFMVEALGWDEPEAGS